MIQFFNVKGELLADDSDNPGAASAAVDSRITIVVYIQYEKGSEDEVDLTFEAYQASLDEWFPIQYEDSAETVANVVKKIGASGKYRLLIATAECESQLRVTATMVNGVDGNVKIYLVPMTPTIR